MNHSINITDFQLVTGYSYFYAFCAQLEVKDTKETQELLCEPVQVSDEQKPWEGGEENGENHDGIKIKDNIEI